MGSPHCVIITGASKGIGYESAKLLAAKGYTVIGLARKAPPHFPGIFVEVDLKDEEATKALLTNLTARFDIDCILNNVGLVGPQKLGEVTIDTFYDVMDLTLRPALEIVQATLPYMKRKGWGRIVNIASLVIVGVPFRTSYSASKAAINSFTRSWAVELAVHGITVNTIAPGPVDTKLFRENNPVGSEGEKRYLSMVPMQRIGKPEEIATPIAFFMSEESSFITGQTLFVDGGASIGRASI